MAVYDDFLCCPLCQEAFRCPKMLTCLHTFCSDCLLAYVDKVNCVEGNTDDLTDEDCDSQATIPASTPKYGTKGIVCPVCEVLSYKTKKIDEKFVENLPDNDFITSLLSAVDSTPHREVVCSMCSGTTSCGSESSHDVTSLDTDISETDCDESPANFWCFDCKVGLCEQCKNKHKENSPHHVTTDISQALQVSLENRKKSMTYCNKHPDETVKYYCVNCRVLGCMDCTVINHKKHYCVSMKEAVKLYRAEIEGLKKKLRNYHNDMHEIKNAIPSYLEKAGQRCEREINDYFDKLVDMLRKKQTELLTELGQIRGVEENKALQSAELSDKYCRTAQRMYDMLRYLLKYGTEAELLFHYETIRKHDIMQQIIRQQDEKLARYTFYSGNAEQTLTESLATGQSLDVSYFRGDFVPKALRLCKNTSEKITIKCRLNVNGKRPRTKLLLDDCDDLDSKPSSLTKMSSRSQSVSNIALLSSLTERRTSDDLSDPRDKASINIADLKLSSNMSHANKNRPAKESPSRDKELEKRLKQRKLEKQTNSSNLKASMGMSKSVTDISLLLGNSKDESPTLTPFKSEVVRRAKRPTRPRPRSTIEMSNSVTTGSKEITNAFERLRRLANMDSRPAERKPTPDKNSSRISRMSLYRPVSQRLGSIENISRDRSDSLIDSNSEYLQSPTVMAVQDDEETSDRYRRHLQGDFMDHDVEMDLSFDDEFQSPLFPSNNDNRENLQKDSLIKDVNDSSIVSNTVEDDADSGRNSADFEIPVTLSSDPILVFNCRNTGAHDAAVSVDADGRYPAGIVCLTDGNMVVADAADNSVKLFTNEGKFLDNFCLHGDNPEPRDVTGTFDGQVAVLYHERQLIAFLSTKNKLCLETTVATSKGYVAIAGYDKLHLVVTCVFPSTIDIVQMDGKIVKSIDMFQKVPLVDKPLFLDPWYITCSGKGEIIVSEYSLKFVLALTKNCDPKFIYKSEDGSLKSTRGVCVATHGNVFLVDEISDNVRVISPLGSFLGYALPSKGVLENPLNIAFNGEDTAVVLQKNGDVKVFKILDAPPEGGASLDCWELQI